MNFIGNEKKVYFPIYFIFLSPSRLCVKFYVTENELSKIIVDSEYGSPNALRARFVGRHF